MESKTLHQIKITLIGTKPPIWRRVLVPSEFTLGQLHDVVQAVMGWYDYHLHNFRVGRQRYGVPEPGDDFPGWPRLIDERKVRLSKVFEAPGAKAVYTYDFGDDWEHDIVVEKIVPVETGVYYPVCIAGKRACPPEDCGGVPGFQDFLKLMADPDHEDYAEMLEWAGEGYDPNLFSLEEANQFLAEFRAPKPKPAAKKNNS